MLSFLDHIIDAHTFTKIKYILFTFDFLTVTHLKSIIYLFHGSEILTMLQIWLYAY